MNKTSETLRQLAAKNTALLARSREVSDAVLVAANAELTKTIAKIDAITDAEAIANPEKAHTYLDLVHRKASLERLLASSSSAASRDGKMQS